MGLHSSHCFLEAPVSVSGIAKTPIAFAELEKLPPLTQLACQHVNAQLVLLRAQTHDRFRLVLLHDPTPSVGCHSRSRSSVGEIRLTTGAVALATCLAARCSIVIEQTGHLKAWMPQLARPSAPEPSLSFSVPFGVFQLSEAKRRTCSLTVGDVSDLEDEISKDVHLLRMTASLASTILEFLVLHEVGHFDALHDEARRMGPLNIKMQRYFEHQADIFAIRLMLHMALIRPLKDPADARTSREQGVRTGINIQSYLGASLAMALITLMRAREPSTEYALQLLESAKGEHPMPTTRIMLANEVIRSELRTSEGRAAIWPGSGELEEATLRGMVYLVMFVAIATINRDWRTSVNRSGPMGEVPSTVRFWLDGHHELTKALEEVDWNAAAQAMELVRKAGTKEGPFDLSETDTWRQNS
ncbi:MAG: hypothetical protein AW06_003036 [Candidatus Accumulibacter cognatus]|uniref:Uncharacterized protein n=1 Tax=Candidatus Accumulibacter cognatus TaxID=2954383 RepID=A0A080MF68_9PROT|nr:MAG: hypothetical protein AW06_003036 [Candidatus Accumulibacter cognatus]